MIRDLHFIILALKSQVKIQYKMAPATLSIAFVAICSAAFFVLSKNWIVSLPPLLDTLVRFVQVVYVPLSLASLVVSLALLLYAFYLRAKVFKLARETNE
jgi:NO-binding membrane sensor protein with MHYT domain